MSGNTDLKNDLRKMLDELQVENGLTNLSRLSGGLFKSIYDVTIENMCNFNMRNYQYMLHHMTRNAFEKNITLAAISGGVNVYDKGNGDNIATPAQRPSYTDGNNYIDFFKGERRASETGVLATRDDAVDSPLYQTSNKFFDLPDNFRFDNDNPDTGSRPTTETGDAWTDANSLLYKTKQLWKRNKIKTIISDFHTKDVKYVGQARTLFGESHGRNLLTKAAENNPNGNYDTNGYNNPYCRVWTHHHKYERFMNGMRANSENLAYWGSTFEWSESEKQNKETREAEYIDGENYDYAWRGRHNQDRKRANTVLDYKTGLVNIAPKYLGGQSSNLHTKSCMFSIENLAWKDYDPYSFEKALSWEQRGPMGGRIMWFPPYGLSITETSSTNWNANDFIGRGEKVYTYVNSERTGNLSFIMLTDHPSSIDYASWYDDAARLNSDNDYLRYFAGCNEGKTEDNEYIKAGNTGSNKSTFVSGMNNDMLIKRPPNLTDEYPNDEGTTVIIPKEEEEKIPEPPDEKPTSTVVEFFVFYPNNYSGYYDVQEKYNSQVDAIAYLLAGTGSQREFSGNTLNGVNLTKDIPINAYNFSNENAAGYEMLKTSGITTSDAETNGNYIVGSLLRPASKYNPTNDRQWKYRIDAEPDGIDKFTVKKTNKENCITQTLYDPNGKIKPSKNNINYSDAKSYFYNFRVSEHHNELAEHKESLYSFAEVAAAIYKVSKVETMYNYLYNLNGINKENIDKLVELFSDSNLSLEVKIKGVANQHAYNASNTVNINRNKFLAQSRGETVENWLKPVLSSANFKQLEPDVKEVEKIESHNENGEYAKLYRHAHVVMTFSSVKVESENQKPNGYENRFAKVEETDNGNAPEFTTGLYFKKVNGTYETVTAQPDDWNENYTSYYEMVLSGSALGTVNVIEHRSIDPPEFTYKQYVGFKYVKSEPHNNQVWNYYERQNNNQYYEQVPPDGNSDNNQKIIENSITVTENQIIALYNTYRDGTAPYGNAFEQLILKEKYVNCPDYSQLGGVEKNGNVIPYDIDSVVKYNDKYYNSIVDFSTIYRDEWLSAGGWVEVDYDEIVENEIVDVVGATIQTSEGDFKSVDCSFSKGDIWGFDDNDDIIVFNYNFDQKFVEIDRETALGYDNWQIYDINHNYNIDDIVVLNYRGDEPVCTYHRAYVNVIQTNSGLIKRLSSKQYVQENQDSIFGNRLICVGSSEFFVPGHNYAVNNVCKVEDGNDYGLYEKTTANNNVDMPFDNADWREMETEEIYNKVINFPANQILAKGGEILGYGKEELYHKVVGNNFDTDIEYKTNSDFDCTWQYGEFDDFYNSSTISTATDLGQLSVDTVTNNHDVYTEQEKQYMTLLVRDGNYVNEDELSVLLLYYISAYKLLGTIRYIQMNNGTTRDVLTGKTDSFEDMELKNEIVKGSECNSNLWVDTGDGRLIQECYLKKPKLGDDDYYGNERKNQLNKLRYDQEYYFYKQYMAEHPIVFERLQEKIKYFEPAFHSMTPEGFNARLTFLQQCTRQGNTKTMSDIAGETANNLAFGRPPYCVLRLGDFYNQLIVIDSISYDYKVSDGLQWDLNPEGNGVQPMLAQINISFKFIGGGDITGPVRRLQNAMSFNYYANTSFYDNRADRVEYQDTNWKTMGGLGNNEVDYDKSYTYVPDLNLPTEDKNKYLKQK